MKRRPFLSHDLSGHSFGARTTMAAVSTLTFWNVYLKGDTKARAELAGAVFRNALGANGEWFAK